MGKNSVIVAGVGMIPFTKPGASKSYQEMGSEAINLALTDAGIDYRAVQQVYAGYNYGDSTSGQATAYRVGMTGVPIINVNNNCSTGSTALYLARQAVESGAAECVLAVGFEQMRPGPLGSTYWDDRPHPMARFVERTNKTFGHFDAIRTARYFGGAGAEHMERFGTKLSTFAEVRAKASRHSTRNPLALFRKEVTVDEVLAAPELVPGVMTRLMACPPTCGAAAAIVVSGDYADRHGIDGTVQIRAQAMTSDREDTFNTGMMRLVGYGQAEAASRAVYESAGVGPDDIDVLELHDCFAQNELILYEALGFAPEGGAEKFILDGDNTYGGKIVTNPSGGLLSKGHPIGATGLAQCFELTMQLRGKADERQVDGARLALAHNVGLGGACVVTLFERQNAA